jgi:hypothetical protein
MNMPTISGSRKSTEFEMVTLVLAALSASRAVAHEVDVPPEKQ